MILENLTSSRLNILDENGNNVSIPAEGKTKSIVASPAFLKMVTTVYDPKRIRVHLGELEKPVIKKLDFDITNWLPKKED